MNFNQLSSAKDHLYYQCISLLNRLSKIDGMEPFLKVAHSVAEQCSEQQALALSQQLQDRRSSTEFRASSGFSIHSDNSNTSSHQASAPLSNNSLNLFTFTAGVLPANIAVDPVTKLWKLFQQGAPLCLLFNLNNKANQIPIIGSDDVRMCKKSVYDFLIAVKMHLKLDDDLMFTISNVFSDSTHDLLKIIRVVKHLLPSSIAWEDNAVGEVTISSDSSKVFREIIETERKYVKDLEVLLKYKADLTKAELISSEQIHLLFPNLSEIIDFQRRFLNGLECNINIPDNLTRIGSIFIHAANGPFKFYEPWTIGQLGAIDLINKETDNLQKSSKLLDPGFELQSFILKPIQRLCKYPLLLKELIDTWSNPDNSSYNELLIASQAMKEVANQVNEAQRRSENVGYLQNLAERVNNWRGFILKDQGELLYHGVVGVKDSDNEKEYYAYLFEKIIFFFVEVNPTNEDQGKKRRDLLSSRKKSSASVNSSSVNLLENMNHAKDKSPLELKGRVYISEIYNISSSNTTGYSMVIAWSGRKESGSFTLRYRTEEFRNQWENCLRNLKTNEMNNQIQRKLRDSHEFESIQPTNDQSSIRSSNGSNFHNQRHHSSSSTFSMMRQSLSKSTSEPSNSRVSSSSLQNFNSSSASNSASTNAQDNSLSSVNSSANNSSNSLITIKIIYDKMEIKSYLMVPASIQFSDLHSKISTKIASSGEVKDDIMVNKLRYKDEDGDFVVMDSNDDWLLALDMFEEVSHRILTIWVS
ncbi:hypothetical protein CANTEDRAFT_98656 [Yamadazyma tenuis ATCC 10573]|uniref:RhoGEF-domain-containing protein n=2 Tax=Candida tenuis TaxID=2315449 RepID=G3BAJ1_CANTC|nr:uncharacterized protein CANTEDRAFT_98656 [Yamadazyma tenuis ATCC 10573]EGV61415.1 hypothetical protein CANTEDRAFT_98656 [Yamadazyma tenuis ATCC 10573]